MELAGTRPTHARAPPGAPVLLNCVRTTHETLFADVPNLSIENAKKKCLRIGSYGVAIGPHCVANLYKGELQ